MTATEFKEARKSLGLSQRELADIWSMGTNGERTIRRWEQGDVPVNPIATYCIDLMLERAAIQLQQPRAFLKSDNRGHLGQRGRITCTNRCAR